MNNKFFIVRGKDSGVFFGNIEARNGQEVTMRNVRRLWYWSGACSISALAKLGTRDPRNCKFTVTVNEVLILDAVEINTCSDAAIKSLCEVPEWKS